MDIINLFVRVPKIETIILSMPTFIGIFLLNKRIKSEFKKCRQKSIINPKAKFFLLYWGFVLQALSWFVLYLSVQLLNISADTLFYQSSLIFLTSFMLLYILLLSIEFPNN